MLCSSLTLGKEAQRRVPVRQGHWSYHYHYHYPPLHSAAAFSILPSP